MYSLNYTTEEELFLYKKYIILYSQEYAHKELSLVKLCNQQAKHRVYMTILNISRIGGSALVQFDNISVRSVFHAYEHAFIK